MKRFVSLFCILLLCSVPIVFANQQGDIQADAPDEPEPEPITEEIETVESTADYTALIALVITGIMQITQFLQQQQATDEAEDYNEDQVDGHKIVIL